MAGPEAKRIPRESIVVVTKTEVPPEKRAAFLTKTSDILTQVAEAPGNLHSEVHLEEGPEGVATAYTTTVWATETAMTSFTIQDPHRTAIRESGKLATPGSFRSKRFRGHEVGSVVPPKEILIAKFATPPASPAK